jgi:molybdate transport system ATP-binding protein
MLLKRKFVTENYPVNHVNSENPDSDKITAQFQLNYGAFQLDVDLQLPCSGISVLFGHSGSGKTTLLRCIAGLQKATQGFLQINGETWQDSATGIFLPTHKRNLGYVFQEANLFAHLTVMGNLCYGLKRIGQNSETEHFKQVIELLGIEHLMQRMPERLSGGERQRVGIARALVLNPEILLMDEPLAALDGKRKQEILPFLTRLHHELNIPVLYVTHSQQEVTQLADYLVLLADGKVQAAGLLSETLSRLDISANGQQAPTSVWEVTVNNHDPDYHLTDVSFADGTLSLPGIVATIGAKLRIQIDARDVSISLEKNTASSILNVLSANVTAMVDDKSGHTLVQLQIGNRSKLLAQITTKSAQFLHLHTGLSVYVQIKGTSLK